MEKSNNQYKSYKALSRHESALLNAIEEFIVFSLSMVQRATGWKSSTVANILTTLKKKKIVTLIKKNNYIVTEKIPEHIFALATAVTAPSYLSFWTAASYYGFTEQQVKTIQVVSTRQYPVITAGEHRIETITYQPSKFYGYHKVQDFAMAEKEKLLVDLLYKPELAGGITEIQKIFREAWPQINQEILLEYVLRFKNKSGAARLGYLTERLKLKSTILSKLQRNLPLGLVKLNPSKKTANQYHKKWRIIINDW